MTTTEAASNPARLVLSDGRDNNGLELLVSSGQNTRDLMRYSGGSNTGAHMNVCVTNTQTHTHTQRTRPPARTHTLTHTRAGVCSSLDAGMQQVITQPSLNSLCFC